MAQRSGSYAFMVGFMVAALMLVAGCNFYDPQSNIEMTYTGADAGARPDADEPPTNTPNGSPCTADQTLCVDQCRETMTDANHCGACDNRCTVGDDAPDGAVATCVDGQCHASCPSAMTDCQGVCVDLTSDSDHCGQCDNPCLTGQCADAQCQPPPCDAGAGGIGGGTGTEDDPLIICAVSHLDRLRDADGQFFLLANNLSLSGVDFEPIDNFSGTLDGLGMTISDLTITAMPPSGGALRPPPQGLFHEIGAQGEVRNLRLMDFVFDGELEIGALAATNRGRIQNVQVDVTIRGQGNLGGIAGTNFGTIVDAKAQVAMEASGNNVGALVGSALGNATIRRSFASGTIEGDAHRVGGLVGDLDNASTITSSTAEVTVQAGRFAGGVAGRIQGNSSISDTTTAGDVMASGDDAGGFVGLMDAGVLENCGASGDVSAARRVGGLVGTLAAGSVNRCRASGHTQGIRAVGGLAGALEDGELIDVYATGPVLGDDQVGGLIGLFNNNGVVNAYAAGMVTGDDDRGGLVGKDTSGEFMSSYWDTQTTGLDLSGTASFDVMGLTTDQFGSESAFPFWDFANTWIIDDGDDNVTRPRLRWELD